MRIFSLIVIFILCISNVFAQGNKVAPNFSMSLLDGDLISLSDYNGKVVYISFWASWCGPCISNFKKYEEIRSELEKEGIILLNVSIDEDESKWKQAIEKLNINGVHTLAKKEDLYPQYQISSIPLYEIVNKEGFFVYLSDEADRDIIHQFRNWVDQ